MTGNDDDFNGSGGPASAFGKSSIKNGKFQGAKSLKPSSKAFKGDSAGKLNKSGATTRSESLARLRGKGALA